jgi:hypothetical protein
MYNYKHPCTWDESLSYVHHSYSRALHTFTGHNPYQVELGFQLLGPIDVELPLATIKTESTHVHSETHKATRFIDRIQHIHQQVQDILHKSNSKYNSAMINTGYRTSFRLETKFGYICIRSISHGPIISSSHFTMGLTLSPRLWVAMLLSSTLHPSLACT